MTAKIIDKKVSLPSLTVLCGDNGAEEITFECDKIWDGISLENIPAYIKVENSFGKMYKGILNKEIVENKMYLKWKIGKEATFVSGKIRCQIVFESKDGTLSLNTMVFKMEIKSSVSEASDEIILEINHITELQNELQRKIDELKSMISGGNLLKVGDNISKLNNDSEFITKNEAKGKYASKFDVNSKTTTYMFSSVSSFISSVKSNRFVFSAGDIVKFNDNPFPQLVCGYPSSTMSDYTYETDEKTLDDFISNSQVKIGKYPFSLVYGKDLTIPFPRISDAGKTLVVDKNGKFILQ